MLQLVKTTLVFFMLSCSLVGYCYSDDGQYSELQQMFKKIKYNDFKHTEMYEFERKVENYADSDGVSILIVASDYGRLEMVKRFIEYGANINQQDTNGNTALLYAARNGHVEVVQYLVEHGADINHFNKENHTALIEASIRGHMNVVQYLVTHGVNINHFNEDGISAVGFAMANNHEDIGKYLVEHGANLRYELASLHHFDILILALRNKNIALAEYLIEHDANVNAVEVYRDETLTPMRYAINLKSINLVKMLVKHGAKMSESDINVYVRDAVGNDDLEIVKYLVTQGTSLNLKFDDIPAYRYNKHINVDNNTCCSIDLIKYLNTHGIDIPEYFMDKAILCTNLDIIKYLIEQRGYNKEEAIISAIYYHNLQVVKYLIDRKTKLTKEIEEYIVTSVVNDGYDDLEMLKYLEEQGLKLDIVDKNGNSLLMLAMHARNVEMTKYLIESGADLEYKNSEGDGIIRRYAPYNNLLDNVQILKLLNERGVKMSDEVLNYTFISACKTANLDTIKYLIERGIKIPEYTFELDDDRRYSTQAFDVVKYLIDHGMANSYEFLLHAASHSVDMVKDFVKRGTEIKKYANDMLFIGAYNGRMDVVQYAIEQGADIYANHNGTNVLYVAARSGNLKLVKYFVERGVSMYTNVHSSALLSAAIHCQLDVVKYLIEQGIDVNYECYRGPENIYINFDGNIDCAYIGSIENVGTVLNAVVLYAKGDILPIIEYLLTHGADINHIDKSFGYTPLGWAVYIGDYGVARYLVEHGADVGKKNVNGTTALDIAENNGDIEMAEYLRKHMNH